MPYQKYLKKDLNRIRELNTSCDHACFMVWESAKPFLKDIRKELNSAFSVLLETEIHWTEENFYRNAFRLYELPLFDTIKHPQRHTNLGKKIGSSSFSLFIVKDSSPLFGYDRSVSGMIEPSNRNITNAKKRLRKQLFDATGERYSVHSSNNPAEFYFQASLMLGAEMLENVLAGKKRVEAQLYKDTEGVTGWKNLNEMFTFLNLCTNYLVIRNFESVTAGYPQGDIDLLTDDFQRLASALGATQKRRKPYKATVIVAGNKISLDLRFIGDAYFPAVWQYKMLNRKVLRDKVFTPSDEDHFFSLLYHCNVQKEGVSAHNAKVLIDLAERLGFDWFSSEIIGDAARTADLLKGFFTAEGYFYEEPLDKAVYKNKTIIKVLPKKTRFREDRKYGFPMIKSRMKNVLPEPVFRLLKDVKNKLN
jgi:hypothetical protein